MIAFNDYYNACKTNKLCAACGTQPVIDTVYCRKCLDNDNVSKKNLKLARKQEGLCIQCGCAPPYIKSGLKKYVRCKQCLDYQHNIRSNRRTLNINYARKYRLDKRAVVFNAYGSRCYCCGEAQVEFLTVDHINNDGAIHRRQIGTGSYALYNWIIKHGFPNDFQLLCGSCHLSKNRGGQCIHQRTK
jgi:serine/threonine protein phosphatase PrpC